MSHSHISRARGHIVRILYVFAQFPMIFRQLFARLGSGIREENEFDRRLGCRFIGRKIFDLLTTRHGRICLYCHISRDRPPSPSFLVNRDNESRSSLERNFNNYFYRVKFSIFRAIMIFRRERFESSTLPACPLLSVHFT